MEVNRLRELPADVCYTLKSLNPEFMHIYLKEGSHFARRKNGKSYNVRWKEPKDIKT